MAHPREAKAGKKRQAKGLIVQQLTPADLDRVLEDVPELRNLEATKRLQLLSSVNLLLHVFEGAAEWRRRNAPFEVTRRLEKYRASFAKTLPMFNDGYIREGIIAEEAKRSGCQDLRLEPYSGPYAAFWDRAEEEWFSSHGAPLNSDVGRHLFNHLQGATRWCIEMIDEMLKFERQRQRELAQRREQRLEDPDEARFAFVVALANQFEKVVEIKPTGTKDKPWCVFLAAVLSCCQARPVKPSHAADIWARAEAWASEDNPPR